MSDELVSLQLASALAGAVVLRRAGDLVPSIGLSELALPELPSLPDPIALMSRGFDHVASTFWARPSGLFVPAAPAIVSRISAEAGAGSGLSPGRIRPGPERAWSDAIDLDALADFLRAQHERDTAKHVARLTGEPVETVRKWLKRETRPGFRATIVLVCIYGPELLEAVLKRQPGWLAEARLGLDRARLAGELSSVTTRLQHLVGGLA